MGTAYEKVAELYGRTHGMPTAEIEPIAMSPDRQERICFWAAFWRELGFEGAQPTGSSRLIEVAIAQSRSGNPDELILALFDVLRDSQMPTEALAYFARWLWIETRANSASVLGVCDCFLPLPDALSRSQAVLVLQFVGDRSLYTSADRAKLEEAQAIAPWHGVSFDDALGEEPSHA
jgi:hypothetical protein